MGGLSDRGGGRVKSRAEVDRLSGPSRSGLEVTYERWLRGKKGVQRYVVNADGETIRRLGEKPPAAGHNVILAMDSRVQLAGWVAKHVPAPAG